MEIKTETKTEQILTVMRILAWVAFIGLTVEVGAILISYGVSCFRPEAAKNLYKGLDLYDLNRFNFWYYTMSVSFMVAFSGMKAYVSFLVIETLSKVNLANPFKIEVALIIERISHVLLGIWVVGMLNNGHTSWLLKKTVEVQGNWINGEFIFMAGLVFILAQVFKRGVELQAENELTI